MPNLACTCACHWLNRRTQTRFTHTAAHRCCAQAVIKEHHTVTATIHYQQPTVTVTTTPGVPAHVLGQPAIRYAEPLPGSVTETVEQLPGSVIGTRVMKSAKCLHCNQTIEHGYPFSWWTHSDTKLRECAR